MIDIAVTAMVSPIRALLMSGSGISLRTGEAGCSIKAVKTHAEIMKIPSSAPSIKYSGQCRARAKPAPPVSDAAVCSKRWRDMRFGHADRIRIGAISDRSQQKKLQK